MSIHSAIYTLLTGNAAINTATDGEIYPALIAQDAGYPAIAFNEISTFPIEALAADTDIMKSRFQFDIIAEQAAYETLKDIGDAVRVLFQRYQGTVDGTEILDVEFDNRSEDFNETTRIFVDRMDFIFIYRV